MGVVPPARGVPIVAGRYTPPVPTEQIARSLAFINWTVLVGLAVGTFVVVVVARYRTEATTGFLRFSSLAAGVFAILAWLSDGALPVPGAGAPIVASPDLDGPRRTLLIAFAVCAVAYGVVVRRHRMGALVATLGLATGFGAIALGAYGWAGGFPDAGPLIVELTALTLATGGVFAAMILGHWYLVTPKLPTGPLLLVSRLLLLVVGVQLVLFVVWLATGAGLGLRPFRGPRGALGVLRMDAPSRGARVPARPVLGRSPDRAHAVDGVGHRPALHRRRRDRRRYHPRGRAVLRRRPARLKGDP